MPWFDFCLAAIIIWGMIRGYLAGPKRAVFRFCWLAGALLVALPLARNCALYLHPMLEPVCNTEVSDSVSTARLVSPLLAPWKEISSAEMVAGGGVQNPAHFVVNLTALGLLLTALLIVGWIVEKPQAHVFSGSGLAVGMVTGLAAVVLLLTAAPALIFGRFGIILIAGAEDSVFVASLYPLVSLVVRAVAPFVF